VGAGSVVTTDLDEWTVYVGSPARVLHPRPRPSRPGP
jgi:acetyltransferase-like isoleucine patch superfamily enzyme